MRYLERNKNIKTIKSLKVVAIENNDSDRTEETLKNNKILSAQKWYKTISTAILKVNSCGEHKYHGNNWTRNNW